MKIMKKVSVSALLAMVLLSMLVVSAKAYDENASFRFDYRINSTATTDPLKDTLDSGFKEGGAGRLYVRHYLTELPGTYTNLFRGKKVDEGTIHGSKWCTPGLNVPIQSSTIVTRVRWRLTARGNTDYYTYMGAPSILVNGNCFYNK